MTVSHALGELDECLNNGGEVILLSLDGTEGGEVGGGVVRSELRNRGKSLSHSSQDGEEKTGRTHAETWTTRPEGLSKSEGDVSIEEVTV